MLNHLNIKFDRFTHDRSIHPSDYITTANSPFDMKGNSALHMLKQMTKNFLGKYRFRGDPRVGVFLTVYAAVHVKRY